MVLHHTAGAALKPSDEGIGQYHRPIDAKVCLGFDSLRALRIGWNRIAGATTAPSSTKDHALTPKKPLTRRGFIARSVAALSVSPFVPFS
jgi:hypothetical protein